MDNSTPKISRIEIDRELCIGAASCVAIAMGVFELDDENKARVISIEGADADTIMLAAKSCPTRAISLFDDQDQQIYP